MCTTTPLRTSVRIIMARQIIAQWKYLTQGSSIPTSQPREYRMTLVLIPHRKARG